MASFEQDVKIAVGDSVSTTVLDLTGKVLVGISLPSTFDGSAMTFQSAIKGNAVDMFDDASDGTFAEVRDATGAAVSLVVTASKNYTLSPTLLRGCRWLKLVSGTAQSTTDTIITVTLETRT